MTDQLFKRIWNTAQTCKNPEELVSQWADSAELQNDDFTDLLETLWHVANDSFRDFLSLVGLTQTGCSTKFCIPLRTVQSWATDERSAPPYLRLMMAEICGKIKKEEIKVEKYEIRYHTGVGDEWIIGTLEEAEQTADDGIAYPQDNQAYISIHDEAGEEVVRRTWYGVSYNPEETENEIIDFGARGYFGAWQNV